MKYLVALLLLCLPSNATAASSQWLEMPGAKLRFLAREAGGGRIEAAFQIVLEDGWKTYWKVPGSSGVPPQITISTDPFGSPLPAGSTVDILYPVPVAFADGAGWAAGYKSNVAFAIDIAGAGGPDTLHASGLIGICADICIPVQFNLSVDMKGSAQSNLEEQRIFVQAKARLPKRAGEGLAVTDFDRSGRRVEVSVPATAQSAFWFDLERGSPIEAERVLGGTATFVLPEHALSARRALVVADDTGGIVTLP